MRVHVGSDHAGWELKQRLVQRLSELGHEVVDHGPASFDASDDYPVYCLRVAEGVAADRTADAPDALGVVIGGSGNGEQLAANEVAGIRAALIWSDETATLARAHNDAQVAAVGARMHSAEDAVGFVETFVATPFSGEERHVRRLAMLTAYETKGVLPPLPGAEDNGQ
jgi:ribose 5-phosphate isomerase B